MAQLKLKKFRGWFQLSTENKKRGRRVGKRDGDRETVREKWNPTLSSSFPDLKKKKKK